MDWSWTPRTARKPLAFCCAAARGTCNGSSSGIRLRCPRPCRSPCHDSVPHRRADGVSVRLRRVRSLEPGRAADAAGARALGGARPRPGHGSVRPQWSLARRPQGGDRIQGGSIPTRRAADRDDGRASRDDQPDAAPRGSARRGGRSHRGSGDCVRLRRPPGPRDAPAGGNRARHGAAALRVSPADSRHGRGRRAGRRGSGRRPADLVGARLPVRPHHVAASARGAAAVEANRPRPAGRRGVERRSGGDGGSGTPYPDDLVAILDALGVRTAAVCGLSRGGYVTFELLRRHADPVSAVLLVDTKHEPDAPATKRERDELAALTERDGPEALVSRLLPKLLAPETQSEVAEQVREMARRWSVPGLVGALQALSDRPDSTEALRQMRVPALVLAGSGGETSTPAGAR